MISTISDHTSGSGASRKPGGGVMTYDPYLGSTSNGTSNGTSNDTSRVPKVPEFLRPLPKPARYHNGAESTAATTLLNPSALYQNHHIRINGGGVRTAPQITPPRPKYLPSPPNRPILDTNNRSMIIDTNNRSMLDSIRPVVLDTRSNNTLDTARSILESHNNRSIIESNNRPILEEAVNLVHKQREYINGHHHIENNHTSDYQRFLVSSTSNQTTTTTATSTTPYYYNNYNNTPASIYFNNQSASRPQFTLSTSANQQQPTYIHIPAQHNNFSPPKPGQSILKDTITKPQLLKVPTVQQQQQDVASFKVPSGKEGSLKHRILQTNRSPGHETKNRKSINGGSLHQSGAHFARGALIQLSSGELKKIEEMRAEDFVSAAERNPALRLDPSTVVRITENSQRPHEGTITLSYGRQGSQQTELEVSLEHPFFVYGKGWASIAPERSLITFDLHCHRLSVGDICISLSPRPTQQQSTISQQQQATINQQTAAAALAAAELLRKRRWSAPDHVLSDDENEQQQQQQIKRTKDISHASRF